MKAYAFVTRRLFEFLLEKRRGIIVRQWYKFAPWGSRPGTLRKILHIEEASAPLLP